MTLPRDDSRIAATQPRGPYAKTGERQLEIIKAAIQVFAIKGYRKSSTRDVAERAGISEAGLRHHFPNKTDLLEAVLYHRDEEDTMETDMESPHATGIDRLRAYVRQVEKNASRRSEVELYAVLSAEATADDHPAHDYFEQRFEWVREVLKAAFVDAGVRDELRDGIDPDDIAREIVALTDGLQVQWLMKSDFDMGEKVASALQRTLTVPLLEP